MSDSPYSGAALRRSGLHFLSGKLLTAALTFAALLLFVRILPLRDYGVYATFIAWLELTIALAGLGLPWLGSRFIPEFRLNADGAALRRMATRVLRWLCGALAVAGLVVGVALDRFLADSGLEDYRIAGHIYVGVILAEGLGRLVIASLLDPLMQQGIVRIALVARQCCLFAVLGLYAWQGRIGIVQVVCADLVAASLGSAIAIFGLLRHLIQLTARVGRAGWVEPTTKQMWFTGLNMYGAYVMTLLYSPQVLLTLVTRVLGAESAAAFGFLRGLFDQIARYLPATLLFNLVRPKLIASFFEAGDSSELIRNANLAGKLSLFVLLPLIAFIGATDGDLIQWLSGGRLSETGLLFFGFALALIPLSQRQLMESIAVASGRSSLCLVAATSGILTIPSLLFLSNWGLGLWAPVAAIGIGQLIFNVAITIGLRRRIDYRPDLAGVFKLAMSAAAGCLAGLMLQVWKGMSGHWLLLVQAVAVALSYLIVAWMLKPFATDERARINGLLKREVFVW